MLNIKKIKDSKYNYIVFFAGKISQFSQYMHILGNIKDKEYDFEKKAWKITDVGYEILVSNLKEKDTVYKPPEPELKTKNLIGTLKSTEVKDYENIGRKMKLSLFPYQKQAIKYCLENPHGIIKLPCGAGKTPIGIGAYIEALEKFPDLGQGVLIVKATQKIQWFKEVKKFSDKIPVIIQTSKEITASTREKIKRKKFSIAENKDNKEKVAILKQEILQLEIKAQTLFLKQFDNADLLIMNYETFNDAAVKQQLHKRKVAFFYGDEIHTVKNDMAKRSKSIYEFADKDYNIGATATIIVKDPFDIYGQFKFIEPTLFPSKAEFGKRYIKFNKYGQPYGSNNEEELVEKIQPYIFTKTKEEIANQLPKLVVIPRYVETCQAQEEMFKSIMNEIEKLKEQEFSLKTKYNNPIHANNDPGIKRISDTIMAKQIFAQELAISEELLKLSESDMAKKYITGCNDNKIDVLIDIVSEIIESGEKVGIFSRFVKLQEILIAKFKAEANKKGSILKDVKIAQLNGSMSDKKRYEEVYDKFRDKEEYKILLLSDAGSHGINLSKAKYLIEMEPAESFAVQTQRHGRIERADSDHDTAYVYQLLAENSYDAIAQKIIQKKEGYSVNIV